MYPDELKYTTDHEWARTVGDKLRIGITHYAQDALGDIVFISLPEVGQRFDPGDSFGEVESTKSVSDVYAPVAGEVVARNDALAVTPELVNSDPYGDGWLIELVPDDRTAADALMDAAGYAKHVEEG